MWTLAGWGFLVFSAIVCHLPQLVLFHFRTVSVVNSRSDGNKNCSSEPLGSKPAHHTCKTNELERCNTSCFSRGRNGFRRVWPAECGPISQDPPVCAYFTSTFPLFALKTLWITNKWAIGEWIRMTWDEWVGERCVGMCVLILSCLRHDSLAGGVWTQGVGWFKCLKATSGPPVLVNHSGAAAWTHGLE